MATRSAPLHVTPTRPCRRIRSADDGVLLRFESNNSTDTRPVLVDLRDHRTLTVTPPAPDTIAGLADLAELFGAVIDS